MSVLNKRNAMIGWAVWKLGKRTLKRKAKGAVPGRGEGTSRLNKPAVAAVAAAVTGALVFWRRRRGDGDDGGDE